MAGLLCEQVRSHRLPRVTQPRDQGFRERRHQDDAGVSISGGHRHVQRMQDTVNIQIAPS